MTPYMKILQTLNKSDHTPVRGGNTQVSIVLLGEESLAVQVNGVRVWTEGPPISQFDHDCARLAEMEKEPVAAAEIADELDQTADEIQILINDYRSAKRILLDANVAAFSTRTTHDKAVNDAINLVSAAQTKFSAASARLMAVASSIELAARVADYETAGADPFPDRRD